MAGGDHRGVYDVRVALTDMAIQLRACRARDGLTLQQLASRCGVAASTIHKIESQQMIPTVTVILKIARGLGRAPMELVRDLAIDSAEVDAGAAADEAADEAANGGALGAEHDLGAWRLDHAREEQIGSLVLEPGQRAILLVERGQGELSCHTRRVRLHAGDCIEVAGEPFTFSSEPTDPAATLLIVSPAGRLPRVLGAPNASVVPSRSAEDRSPTGP